MGQLKDQQTKIEEITSSPFQFALQIEYDREVITVRVFDNWGNHTVFFSSSTDKNAANLIEMAYQKVKSLQSIEERKEKE